METHKKFTIRIPPDLDARVRAYRKVSGITTNHFGCQALEEALERAGVKKLKRKPAKSA